jgi:predicted nucleic acid-binding protein
VQATLVDTNVLIDYLDQDSEWFSWAAEMLADVAENGTVVVNPIIYAEVAVAFDRVEDVETALPPEYFVRAPIPWGAAFLAGKVFHQYRRRGGKRTSPLPDFFIGAHAAVAGMTLLTRDARRYRTYFPKLRIIAPTAPSAAGVF